jgi:hypothetical protein
VKLPRRHVRLLVRREGVEVIDESSGTRRFIGGYLLLERDRKDVKVFSVGERSELEAIIQEARLAGQIPPGYRLRKPGEDAVWNPHWVWPAVPAKELPPLHEALLIRPLQASTWSPPLIEAVLRYAVALVIGLPRFAPRIELEVSPDFQPIERAELLDVVEGRWGRRFVSGLDDVARLPQRRAWEPAAMFALLAVGFGACLLRIEHRLTVSSIVLALIVILRLREDRRRKHSPPAPRRAKASA